MTEEGVERAWLLYQQGRFGMARECLVAVLAENPALARGHSLLAVCHLAEKRFGEAEAEAREGLRLAPGSDDAHYTLGFVLASQEKLRLARKSIDEAIALAPRRADYHALRSAVLYGMKEFDGALQSADAALEIDPRNHDAWIRRGVALRGLNRLEEAEAASREALALDPQDANAHVLRGQLQGTKQDDGSVGADGDFREALRLEPDHRHAETGLIAAHARRYWLFRRQQQLLAFTARWRIGRWVIAPLLGVPVGLHVSGAMGWMWWAGIAMVMYSWLQVMGADITACVRLLDDAKLGPTAANILRMQAGSMRHGIRKIMLVTGKVLWPIAAAAAVFSLAVGRWEWEATVVSVVGSAALLIATWNDWLWRVGLILLLKTLFVASLVILLVNSGQNHGIDFQRMSLGSKVVIGGFVGMAVVSVPLLVRYVGPRTAGKRREGA